MNENELLYLMTMDDPHIRFHAVLDESATEHVFAVGLFDSERYIREMAAQRTGMPELLEMAIKQGRWQVRETAARNPNMPPELLAIAAYDRHRRVREAVASNPNTPPEILSMLLGDPHWKVKYAAVVNSSTPFEAVIAIFQNWDVRSQIGVLRSAPVSSNILMAALQSPSEDVRLEALNRSNPTFDNLVLARQNTSEKVRVTVMHSPHITPELLADSLRDSSYLVRRKAFSHSGMTAEIHHQWTIDWMNTYFTPVKYGWKAYALVGERDKHLPRNEEFLYVAFFDGDSRNDNGTGIKCGTLDWCQANIGNEYLALVLIPDDAHVCLPLIMDGRFRASQVYVLEILAP